jgi:hypothetical protein
MKKTSFGLQLIDQKLADLLKPMFVGSKKNFILINNLTKNWSEIVGKKYEKLCYPQSVKFDKEGKSASLTIAVHNPAVGFFLDNNSEIITERIAVLYGFKSINKIIIKQDPKNISSDNINEIKLSKDQEENLKRRTSEISDENLAEVLRKLGKEIVGDQ